MELHTEDAKNSADTSTSDLSSEISRILETVKAQLEEEFRKRLEAAVEQAKNSATGLADSEREQAVTNARSEVTAELRAQFDQTLVQRITQLQSDFERRTREAREEWDEEKERIQEQVELWRTYAEAQRLMFESNSQGEILNHFLQRTEGFAPNLAIYVARPGGLILWKTRGDGPFPHLISQDTSDPDAYFKTITVRERTVAAISARQPYSDKPLAFLCACLERAVEVFGFKLQSQKTKAAVS
jgi:hypothetical protein